MPPREPQYKYYSSARSAEEEFHLKGPLVGEWEQDPSLWKDLAFAMKKFMRTEGLEIKSATEKTDYDEDWQEVVEGVVNLINYILAREKSGQKISSIFFLDKSARPGAYFLKRMWMELQKNNTVASDLPPFFFMNIGQGDEHKHNRKKTNTLVKEAFKDRLQDGVVVVDEYIDSGTTARLALKTLQDVYGVEAVALAQHKHLPDWYSWPNITGVEDSPVPLAAYIALENLSEQEFQVLYQYSKQFRGKPEEFEKKYFIAKHPTLGIFNIIPSNKVPDEVADVIVKLRDARIRSNEVYKYFQTYGGFITQPDSAPRDRLLKHRVILDQLAKLVAPSVQRVNS